MVCTWLRQISSCSYLPALPGPAWVLLSKIYIPFFSPCRSITSPKIKIIDLDLLTIKRSKIKINVKEIECWKRVFWKSLSKIWLFLQKFLNLILIFDLSSKERSKIIDQDHDLIARSMGKIKRSKITIAI